MDKLIFGIVILHIIVGFGWVIYKLEFEKKKPKNENNEDKKEKK